MPRRVPRWLAFVQRITSVAVLLGWVACRQPPVRDGTVLVPREVHDASRVTQPAPKSRPTILFASPTGSAYLDSDYLRELRDQDFEVDYTDSLDELTPDRLRPFDVLVLFVTPDALGYENGIPSSPDRIRLFRQLIDEYLAAGGGLLLMPEETNVGRQRLAEISGPLGAEIPLERIVEKNEGNLAQMAHSSRKLQLAYTDLISDSPISDGIKGLWYPYNPMYWAAQTMPLVVDDHWQIVVRTSSTAMTQPVDVHTAVDVAPNPVSPRGPVEKPPIVAIRTVGPGRVAFIPEWPQFSVGAGTKWIYDREVLERGLSSRRSDFGRLLINTYRWLAEPAQRKDKPTFETPAKHLNPPNASEDVEAIYRSAPPVYDRKDLERVTLAPNRKLFRGLIGARTAYSSGNGDVAQFARAARRAHLDFVVFLEDFEHLSPEKLDRLATDCAANSGNDLLLLPGYEIVSNLGNRLFLFGPRPAWPPESILTGTSKNLLYVQEQLPDGRFTGFHTPFREWVLQAHYPNKGQVGFYDFIEAPKGMRLHDARLYSMAGIRYYRNGRLVDDALDDYLVTAGGTVPPSPVSIDEVDSPIELEREAASSNAMTYAEGASLRVEDAKGIFQTALRWASQYDAMPVSLSSGPQILEWPDTHRVSTYGAEGFAPERSAREAPLSIASQTGLAEVRIYDGPRLFRRYLANGAKDFQRRLVLDDELQRDLVVVARDRKNGTAVSFARRSWSDNSLAPVFCADHINDCELQPILAHGPWPLPLDRTPLLPREIAGRTWDGGPPPALPAVVIVDPLPTLVADEGVGGALRLDPIPHLEFADSEAVAVESDRREEYDKTLLHVAGPWDTGGPIDGISRWFENPQRYREWVAATTGAPSTGWAAEGVRAGTIPSLFTSTLRFHRTVHVHRLWLAHLGLAAGAKVVLGGAEDPRVIDPASNPTDVELSPGSWLGIYGEQPMNAQLFWNRGKAVRLHIASTIDVLAGAEATRFEPGDEYKFEVSAMAFPIDDPITSVEQLARYVDFIRDPKGLAISRGSRVPSPGVVELRADSGGSELSIPKADGFEELTLPVRLTGLNPRWSVGLLQEEGYSPGFYGVGRNRYRSLGVDADGVAYFPMYVGRADVTKVDVGHPIVADPAGRDLFIQVTCLGGAPFRWHVEINNPGDQAVTTVVRQALQLPGLQIADQRLTIPAGGQVVLR